jgi:hypothetical protein
VKGWLAVPAIALALVPFGGGAGDAGPRGQGGSALLPPPPAPDDPTLPPLPTRSARNANYAIDASLDPVQHEIVGTLVLDWRNITKTTVSTLPIHLYWNAFENNLSTRALEEERTREASPASPEARLGFTHVQSASLEGTTSTDLMPSFRYVHPDDANADDHTVGEFTLPKAVGPGESVRLKIAWTSRIPYGDVGRAGFVNDYNFIAQWFPKVGVLEDRGWNCHQFHATTEFFSDYGVYDVSLTVPESFVVGATGRLVSEERKDRSKTLRFHEEDVHDFAWTASPRFLERTSRFADPGYPEVAIRLLLQPEHEGFADRYLEATKIALRSYGTWSSPYPYGHVTVVDPAWNSASGGMEYPTLFTGGVRLPSPRSLESPELVTIHECGHQFWYGLVGNNEFEEAWLDEGFNTYHEWKAAALFLGPRRYARRYFGPSRGRGIPAVSGQVLVPERDGGQADLREGGTEDAMAREGWRYRTPESYGLNSYTKPGLVLETLEALVGDETMTRIMRTYARRYRFAHPKTADFIATVNEVTGKDYGPFFAQTFFSSDVCDYAIEAKNEKARRLEGFTETGGGLPRLAPKGHEEKADGAYDSEVTVLRLGGVRLPVEVLVEFEDGQQVRETWDGEYRWTRFTYHRNAKVKRAVVDPEGKLAIDVDPTNNAWVEKTPEAPRAALRWTTRWMLFVQNLFELETVFS